MFPYAGLICLRPVPSVSEDRLAAKRRYSARRKDSKPRRDKAKRAMVKASRKANRK